MDIELARQLVSAALVIAVVIFSLITFEAGIYHIVRDYEAGRRRRRLGQAGLPLRQTSARGVREGDAHAG